MGKSQGSPLPADEILTAEEQGIIQAALTVPGASEVVLPEFYARVVMILHDCDRLDECRQYIGKADMIGVYAKQAKDDRMEAMARRINARAWRRLGELLNQCPQARMGPTTTGVPRKYHEYARAMLPHMSADKPMLSHRLAELANIPGSAAKHIGTLLVNCGLAESFRGPNGGVMLKSADARKMGDDEIVTLVTSMPHNPRRKPDQIPRELTQRGVAEASGITKGEQRKATKIAELPLELFNTVVESERSVSGYQLLRARGSLPEFNTRAYGLGPGNMRKVVIREIGEFAEFTRAFRPEQLSRAFGGDADSIKAMASKLGAWFLHLQKELESCQ
jgi:hypothetical protein